MTIRLNFEADPEKAASNWTKHGVTFEEAATIFSDPLASTLADDQHSEAEERLISIGRSSKHRLLFVVYTETDDRIRLIGARAATPAERRQYEQT